MEAKYRPKMNPEHPEEHTQNVSLAEILERRNKHE